VINGRETRIAASSRRRVLDAIDRDGSSRAIRSARKHAVRVSIDFMALNETQQFAITHPTRLPVVRSTINTFASVAGPRYSSSSSLEGRAASAARAFSFPLSA